MMLSNDGPQLRIMVILFLVRHRQGVSSHGVLLKILFLIRCFFRPSFCWMPDVEKEAFSIIFHHKEKEKLERAKCTYIQYQRNRRDFVEREKERWMEMKLGKQNL